MLDLEEKDKQEENEEKENKTDTDTQSSDSKGDNTKKEDKINTDSSVKSQDKQKEDTRQEKDSKTDREATGDNKEPTEQQPREEEGNKDPGGVNGAQTPASDAKEPENSSDTDNSQRALNGECQSFQICWFFKFDFIPIFGYHVHISNKMWCLLCLNFFLKYL